VRHAQKFRKILLAIWAHVTGTPRTCRQRQFPGASRTTTAPRRTGLLSTLACAILAPGVIFELAEVAAIIFQLAALQGLSVMAIRGDTVLSTASCPFLHRKHPVLCRACR